MSLLNLGEFQLHGGSRSNFKIDCDALSDEDIECAAFLLACRLPPYSEVEGVPTGGLRLAEAMRKHASTNDLGWLLIVDDVSTTGKALEEQRRGRLALGAVIFSRGKTPHWVIPLFKMTGEVA